MQKKTSPNAAILPAHCALANAMNCDPETLPPGQSCPSDPDRTDFKATVTGLDSHEQVVVTRKLYDSSGGSQGQNDFVKTGDGDLPFDPITIGWRYDLGTHVVKNPNKSCTASPSSGTAGAAPVEIDIQCSCNTPVSGAAAGTSCPFGLPDFSLFLAYVPLIPGVDVPWWIIDFGPIIGLDPPCRRDTVCVDGPTETVTLDNGDTIVSQTLLCSDQCVGLAGADATLYGPSVLVRFPEGPVASDGTLAFDGWAIDTDGVQGFAFYIDQTRVTPLTFETGLPEPEACNLVPAANRPGCDPNGGFQGTLDTSALAEGPHTFEMIPVDADPAYPVPTLAQRELTVGPACTDAQDPETAILTPGDGSTVAGVVPVEAAASDDTEVVRVDFYLDGRKQHSDFGAPYTFSWDSTALPDGPHRLRSIAIDGCGNRRASGLVAVLVANTSPPGIAAQPVDQAVLAGDAAQFHVEATGTDPLAYRWQKDGLDLADGGYFSGATTPTLTVSQVDAGAVGAYRVRVSNAEGSTLSTAALLAMSDLPGCHPDSRTLCLQGGRFSVRSAVAGQPGTVLRHSDAGGFFTTTGPQSVEVAVKILDATTVNGRFWVFHGALTHQAYEITVTDTAAGTTRIYAKAAGNFCGGADTTGFPTSSFADALTGTCVAGPTSACLLDGRFKVEVERNGVAQQGDAITGKSAVFSFGATTAVPEVVVKVLDGSSINGHEWVFFGSLTDQDYQVIVTDTVTGEVRVYPQPGALCGQGDTQAF